jgi:hypothetical protein
VALPPKFASQTAARGRQSPDARRTYFHFFLTSPGTPRGTDSR